MTIAIWISLGGVSVAALALIYAALKDTRHKAREEGSTTVILSGINNKLGKLDERQTRYEGKQEAYLERLVTVEQSTKSAHKRIDGLENKINGSQ